MQPEGVLQQLMDTEQSARTQVTLSLSLSFNSSVLPSVSSHSQFSSSSTNCLIDFRAGIDSLSDAPDFSGACVYAAGVCVCDLCNGMRMYNRMRV